MYCSWFHKTVFWFWISSIWPDIGLLSGIQPDSKFRPDTDCWMSHYIKNIWNVLVLQKAGTHMEYTFLASYIVMLVGFLIMDNMERQGFVRQFLKGNNFSDMVELLKKFFNFMNLTASVRTNFTLLSNLSISFSPFSDWSF